MRLPNGYWRNPENVKSALDHLIEKLGHFPTTNEIIASDLVTLLNGITRHWDGIAKAREKLGYDSKLDEPDCWRNWKNAKRELLSLADELGHLPNKEELESQGLSRLFSAIDRYHGGAPAVRKKLKIKSDRKPIDYWKDSENVIKESRKVMKKYHLTYFPSGPELANLGYHALASGINRYHNYATIRKQLKAEDPERGKWKNIDFVMEKTREILKKHKLTELPPSKTLHEMGYSGYVAGIGRYHGGIQTIREKLGQTQLIGKRRMWKDLDFTLHQAVCIMTALNTDTLPSSKTLNKHGYSNLWSAITRYHGGMPVFREQLDRYRGVPTSKQQLEQLLGRYAGE